MTTSIFDLSSSTSPDPKVHVSHTSIPQSYIDPSQPPVRRCPYRQINNTPYLRSVQICMPSTFHATLFPREPSSPSSTGHSIKYSKVILNLRDILDNEALRKGNHILLSSPLDSTVRIYLQRGTLKLIMPQRVYQRSGLTFPSTKLQSGGRKHEKNSALQKIEVDLRQPGMTKGTKGFDRLMYAAKNVDGLREARVCLCVDLDQQLADFGAVRGKKRKREDGKSSTMADQRDVDMSAAMATDSKVVSDTSSTDASHNHILANHHPTHVTDNGTTSVYTDVLVPPVLNSLSTLARSSSTHDYRLSKISPPSNTIFEDDAHEFVEYLSLLFLKSPQLTKHEYGKTDMYLSQYRLPDPSFSLSRSHSESRDTNHHQQQLQRPLQDCNGVEIPPGTRVQDLHIITYEGLISSDWMVQMVIDLIRRSRVEGQAQDLTADAWIVIKAVAHDVEPVGGKDGYMIMLHGVAANETMVDNNNDGDGDGDGDGGNDMLFDQEKQNVTNKEMVVDKDTTTEQESRGMRGNEAKISARGFSSVTCFEFIDSFS